MERIFPVHLLSKNFEFFFLVANDDFIRDPSLSITFPASPLSDDIHECASIDIVNDIDIECDHSFTVEVGDIMCDVDPPIVSATPSATVTIADDDGMLSYKHVLVLSLLVSYVFH